MQFLKLQRNHLATEKKWNSHSEFKILENDTDEHKVNNSQIAFTKETEMYKESSPRLQVSVSYCLIFHTLICS